MTEDSVRVVLADDHGVMRAGLRRIVEAMGRCEIVGEAATVDDAVRYVGAHRPDVLILDLGLADGSSLPAIPALLEASPTTAIVVLTMEDDPAYARSALQAGAVGYVLKEGADTELVAAVHAAAAGRTYVNPELAVRALRTPDREAGRPGGLSEREAEVLGLIALGHTNGEIAERLVLSVRTIETHRAHIQHKLGIGKRSDLVRYALDHRLVERDGRRLA
jgi:two-component system response regulator NreC